MFASWDQLVVNFYSVNLYLEALLMRQYIYPCHIVLLEALFVITTELEITAVHSQTHAEHFLFDQPLLFHGPVYGHKPILPGLHVFFGRQAQYSINFLAEKKISFFFNAAESVFEVVVARFTKMELIGNDIALVVTAFSIPLGEATTVVVSAVAVAFGASAEGMRGGLEHFKVRVQMVPAGLSSA